MTKITIFIEDEEDGSVSLNTDIQDFAEDSNAMDLVHRISLFLIEETGMESIMETTAGLERVASETLPSAGSGV